MDATITLAAIGLLAGVAIGCFFFGGLWYTVLLLPGTRRPALLMTASAVLRLTAALVGFYLLIAWLTPAIWTTLIGFLGARLLIVRRVRRVPMSYEQ